jgi:hypothetical protein
MVAGDGSAFLLPAAPEAEGPLVSLCPACGRYVEGERRRLPECGGPAETVMAVRPPRRVGATVEPSATEPQPDLAPAGARPNPQLVSDPFFFLRST